MKKLESVWLRQCTVYQIPLVKQGRFEASRTINAFFSYERQEQVAEVVPQLNGQMLNGHEDDRTSS